MALIKKTKAVENVGTEFFPTISGNVHQCTTVKTGVEVSQKLKIEPACEPALLRLGNIPEVFYPTTETPEHVWSLLLYSQSLGTGNSEMPIE